jgi:hypothetical protein
VNIVNWLIADCRLNTHEIRIVGSSRKGGKLVSIFFDYTYRLKKVLHLTTGLCKLAATA